MKIVQRNPQLFAPTVTSIVDVPVNVTATSTASESSGGLTYDVITPATLDRRYRLEGFNLDNITITTEGAGQVDASEFPLLKAAAGFTGITQVVLNNGKAKSYLPRLSFAPSGGSPVIGDTLTAGAGSYAEYSKNIVVALADAVPDRQFISPTAPYHRVNLATFPHAELTGIVWNFGKVGPLDGKKFTAITKRHVVGCGHYGCQTTGVVLKWLTADNVEISRTILAVYNLMCEGPNTYYDTEIYVLDSDLPTSIVPIKIPGDWYWGKTSATPQVTTYKCLASFGIAMWGRDGAWSPACPYVQRYPFYNIYSGSGFGIGLDSTDGPFDVPLGFGWSAFGRPDLRVQSDLTSNKFYHDRRAGDSGSPDLAPCTGGWMLVGSAQGDVALTARAWNAIIGIVDAKAGVATGYTVTVATNPTL